MKMNFRGLLWRQFFYYSVVIVAIILVFTFVVTREVKYHHMKAIEANLLHQAQLVEEILRDVSFDGYTEEIRDRIVKIGKRIGTRITIIKTDGTVVGDSQEDPENMDDHSSRPEVQRALRGDLGTSVRFSKTVRKVMVYVALPIRRGDMIVGIIRTSLPLRGVEELLVAINQKILYWAGSLVVLALLFSFVSSRAFTRPIREMVQATKEIAGGNFAQRVATGREGELEDLAHALNWMTEELERLFTEVKADKENLATMLSSMVEGVIVLDSESRIVLTNDEFNKMWGVAIPESFVGKYYWEMLRNSDFKQLVDAVRKNGRAESLEVHVGDRIYLGDGSLIPNEEEGKENAIAVLHDITEIKHLEQLKAEFVANASHELRTPLTVIKGFVEMLEERLEGDELHYVTMIKTHADRMINLVSDLLLLSQLEGEREKFEMKDVDLKSLTSAVVEVFKEQANNKGLTFHFFSPDRLPQIHADPFLIEQVLINLLDNALKYTAQGSIKVELSMLKNEVKMEVSDTGVGIERSQISRIFERFYTIDKTRSRELGGTGLGLSIVKRIILAHRGQIYVESELGTGSKFIVTLPTRTE